MIGTRADGRNEPFGLTWDATWPIAWGRVPGLLLINPRAGTESPTRRRARRRGAGARDPGARARRGRRRRRAGALGRHGRARRGGRRRARSRPWPPSPSSATCPSSCIPYGTRNHFARDLGLDRDDPLAALEGFEGEERRVDVGRAGERRFLNNVSLGVYATLVHRREHHRRRRQVFAGLRALWLAHASPSWRLGEGRRRARPGAHPARREQRLRAEPVLGRRARAARRGTPPPLHGERRAARGRWEERSGERFELDAPGGKLQAAVDGEPVELETPLELAIEPRALRVLLPGREH